MAPVVALVVCTLVSQSVWDLWDGWRKANQGSSADLPVGLGVSMSVDPLRSPFPPLQVRALLAALGPFTAAPFALSALL